MNQYAYMTVFTRESLADKAKTPSELRGDALVQHYRNRNEPRKLQAINRDRKARGLSVIHKPGAKY